jgi:hypothetical protein
VENARVITLNGTSRYPGADPVVWERFRKWQQEVYGQVQMRVPQRRQVDMYQSARGIPLFPAILRILHYENYAGYEESRKNSEAQSISSEYSNWMQRGIIDVTWSAVYRLISGYRSERYNSTEQADTRIENAPYLHLEAYRLPPEDTEKYRKWFIEVCSRVFVPLFLKQTGFKRYDFFEFVNIAVNYDSLLYKEYPAYLSIIYFENPQAFENFEKSNELEVCKTTLRDIFPGGLKYDWYVQYELLQTWRK